MGISGYLLPFIKIFRISPSVFVQAHAVCALRIIGFITLNAVIFPAANGADLKTVIFFKNVLSAYRTNSSFHFCASVSLAFHLK